MSSNIPNPNAVTSAPTSSIQFSLSSFSGVEKGIMGILLIPIVVLSVFSYLTTDNDIKKDNFTFGAVAFSLPIFALIIYRTGIGPSFVEFLKGSKGGVGTVVLVFGITIAIFVALFFNYSPQDTLPFSSAILIGLLVIGTLATLYVFSGRAPIANTIARFGFSLYFFMPYAIFTFGLLTDMLLRDIQYTPASFVGLTGVLLNYAYATMMNGGNPIVAQNPLCEIPGMSQFSSNYVPQPMMFTQSAIAYIATYISRSNVGGVSGYVVDADYRWPAWVLYFGIFGIHTLILGANGCLNANRTILGLTVPLAWGGIMGLIGFSVLERTGRSNNAASQSGGAPVLGATVNTQLKSDSPTCSAVGNGDEFVCESFKNGKLETKVLTE